MNPPDPPAHRTRSFPGRNDALDGLRGLAIAGVLWLHLVQAYLPPGRGSWLGWLRAGTGLSWAGVDLFFVLSGFFIGGILIDQRDSPRLVRVFYLRRAVRILPLYYVTLAAAAAAIFAGLPGSFHLFPPWVYALFLTNFAIAAAKAWDWLPLSVLWTLAVEEQFYITAPWVVRAIPRPLIPWLAAGLAGAAELARATALLVHPGGQFSLHVLTPFRMDTLSLGVLAAWAVRSGAAEPFFARLAAHWRTWLVLGLALLGGLDLLQPSQGSQPLVLFGYLLIAMVFTLVVLVVAKLRPPGLCGFLELRPLVHLGRHSYFVYLWHGLLGASLIRWIGGPDFTLDSLAGTGIVLLGLGATWLAAAASWRWFEGPLVAWGQRQAY
ncbi:MAG TPA: acyltransferase [Opitutaceae bacterium]|nr:acyltransferase [Opitutaceae bacterium]